MREAADQSASIELSYVRGLHLCMASALAQANSSQACGCRMRDREPSFQPASVNGRQAFSLCLVKPGQVLENKVAPHVASCLDEHAALVDLPELDRGEAESLDERRH